MRKPRFPKFRRWMLAGMLCACLPAYHGCIDEDLSGCDSECNITFQLRLEMDLKLTIQEVLNTGLESVLADSLLRDLQGVISDKARSIDLSFYNSADGLRIQHDSLQTNANELTTRLYLQAGAYEHIAVANTADEPAFIKRNADQWTAYNIVHDTRDTVSSQTSAIYTGNLHMDIDPVSSQTFYVPLHMQNSIAVLVIDPQESPAKVLSVYTNQVACGINCIDQQFIFDNKYVVRNSRTEGGGLISYYAVCFPSRESAGSTKQTPAEEAATGSIWHMEVITQTPDGKYVRNILYIKEPLLAGQAKVLKVYLGNGGEIISNSSIIGVSIIFDWKPGGNYDIEI